MQFDSAMWRQLVFQIGFKSPRSANNESDFSQQLVSWGQPTRESDRNPTVFGDIGHGTDDHFGKSNDSRERPTLI